MNIYNNFQLNTENKLILKELLNKNPILKSFMIGSFSGTCSTLLFQPLDLVKTRMQSGVYSSSGKHAMVSVVNDIVKNESIFSLWRGTIPSLLRCVPGVGIYFSSVDWLQCKILISKNNRNIDKRSPTALEAVLIGLLARSFAGTILLPFTVLKTRYESGLFKYKSFKDAFHVTYLNEGIKGLYRGLSPTLLRDAPFSGLYYMFFSQLKKLLNEQNNDKYIVPNTLKPFVIFSFGLTSGLLASLITHPADVIKTKVQLDPMKHKNILRTSIIIFNQKGFNGFFAGLAPRMIRRTLMASMAWTVYESLMKEIGLK